MWSTSAGEIEQTLYAYRPALLVRGFFIVVPLLFKEHHGTR